LIKPLKNKQYQKVNKILRKYLTLRYLIIGIIIIVLLLIFEDFVKGIILTAIFIPMGVYSVRATRFVNYITLETVSASAILMGFMFGPIIGFFFGLFVLMFSYIKSSVTKLTAVVDCFLTGFAGIVPFVIKNFFPSISFSSAFIVGILTKNIIGWIVFIFLDPDQLQNITYRTTHIIWNIVIVRLLFILIYNVINLI
jgi:hypothetical protein